MSLVRMVQIAFYQNLSVENGRFSRKLPLHHNI